ncbi:MAG TPA: efflux RND transporter periplasmic adaptor subunit [Terriglobales bacterium]|nr:efflux RND transporter periplasmic adaptor subunit [Terriglobales bacterium]
MLLAASLAGLAACDNASSASRPLTPVRLAEVQTVTLGNPARYSANIVPYSQVDLAFRSGGYIDSIRQVRGSDGRMRNIDEGDWVDKGTTLAVVHQQDYQDKLSQANAQLANAQAEYDHAKLQFDRTSALYSAQSATKPDYDQANAALQSATAAVSGAKASVSEAQIALGYCSLQAPFDGWIVKRNVDVGSLVSAATNGFTLADTSSVKAVFGVPDFAISRVQLGQRQALTTDAVSGNFGGRITAISPAADPKSRVYSVEVTIPNSKNLLKSGMIASITMGGESLPGPVVAVPLAAVIRDPSQPGGFAVLVAEGTGDSVTVRSRSVGLGNAYGNLVAVTGGLRPGERVVTSGASMVKSGDQVRVIPD